MSVVTFLLWLTGSSHRDPMLWVSLAIVAVMTYIIVEWNNQCQLLRIRSRMNSVTFLAMMCVFPALHVAGWALMPAFCLLVAYFMLFKTYGEYRPQGYAFHGFLFLGLGALFFPPMLLLAPTLFMSCNLQLRILTLKTMSALALGLLLPFWLYAAGVCVAAPLWGFEETRLAYLSLHLPDYSALEPWQYGSVAFVLLVGTVGVVHFLTTSYNDKIRTRQYFFTMLISFVPLIFCLVWWPEDFSTTLSLLVLNTTPFVAHYLTLSRFKWMDGILLLAILLAVCMATANYCDLWQYLETGIDLPTLLEYIPL